MTEKGSAGKFSGIHGVQRGRFLEMGIVVLFLVAITAVAWVGISHLEENACNQSAETLRTVLRASYKSVTLWTDSQLQNAKGMAAEEDLIVPVRTLLSTERQPEALLGSPAMQKVRDLLAPQIDAMEYEGFAIIAPDYTNIGSMRDGIVGTTNVIALHRRDVLDQVLAGQPKVVPAIITGVPDDAPRHRLTMFVAVPVRDGDAIIGALALRINPMETFTDILASFAIGSSGETYAFDREGWLITESRFDEELMLSGVLTAGEVSVLNVRITDPGGNLLEGYQPDGSLYEQPLTVMARSATKGFYGVNVQGYRDYRGVRVFGAWGWDESLGFGMATEIDESEAMATYDMTRALLMGGYVLTAVLAVLMAWYLSRLRQSAASRLQEAHATLEGRIKERTSDLMAINERLHGEIVERVRTEEKLLQAQSELEMANEQLERLASQDGLTGIPNRRIFDETLEREWKRCMRDSKPISLLMFDIDHFKAYNDTYGHQAGDACLKAIGSVLNDLGVARRPGDLVARYGGEEFAIILSDATPEHAVMVARKMKDAVMRLGIPHSSTLVENQEIVTVSIGLATLLPAHGESAGRLVEYADEALYSAKNGGRNRYEIFEPDDESLG